MPWPKSHGVKGFRRVISLDRVLTVNLTGVEAAEVLGRSGC
jgi:hypothetical protein